MPIDSLWGKAKSVVGLFLLFLLPVRAQLADTIWEGNLAISNLNFQAIEEGALQYPTLQGGKIVVPVEIWYWSDGAAWLMFDNHKWGLVDRERTQVWLPKGIGSSSWDSASTYSFNARSKKGTIQGRSTRLKASSWNYIGHFYAWSGSFAVSGNRMTLSKLVLTTDSLVEILAESDDPKNRPTGIKFAKMPSFGNLTLQKTNQKPSQAIQGEDWD